MIHKVLWYFIVTCISKVTSRTSLLFWGGIFFLFQLYSCRNSAEIKISQSDSVYSFKEIYGNSDMAVYGAYILKMSNKPHFTSFLKCRDTLSVIHLFNPDIQINISLMENAKGICSKDSSVYIFYEARNYYTKITITDSFLKKYTVEKKFMSPLFTSSFFISANNYTRMFVLDSNHFLTPYRVDNETKNMIDTFAYIYYYTQNADSSYKLVNYINREKYEYLYKIVSEYDYIHHNLIYCFQKSNVISVANMITKETKTFALEKFNTIDFPQDKHRNLTYIRNYIKKNDKLQRIVCNEKGDMFLIVKLCNNARVKYRLYFRRYTTEELKYVDVNFEIYPELAFIKNDKLYVPNENYKYSVFSVDIIM